MQGPLGVGLAPDLSPELRGSGALPQICRGMEVRLPADVFFLYGGAHALRHLGAGEIQNLKYDTHGTFPSAMFYGHFLGRPLLLFSWFTLYKSSTPFGYFVSFQSQNYSKGLANVSQTYSLSLSSPGE